MSGDPPPSQGQVSCPGPQASTLLPMDVGTPPGPGLWPPGLLPGPQARQLLTMEVGGTPQVSCPQLLPKDVGEDPLDLLPPQVSYPGPQASQLSPRSLVSRAAGPGPQTNSGPSMLGGTPGGGAGFVCGELADLKQINGSKVSEFWPTGIIIKTGADFRDLPNGGTGRPQEIVPTPGAERRAGTSTYTAVQFQRMLTAFFAVEPCSLGFPGYRGCRWIERKSARPDVTTGPPPTPSTR
eukprot:gene7664-biopygen13609